MPPVQLIVHSMLTQPDRDVIHNVQSDNLARLKQAKKTLHSKGYEVFRDVWSEGGFHAFEVWSIGTVAPVSRVSVQKHQALLRTLHIPLRTHTHTTPNVVSTYAAVGVSRTKRRSPSASPPRRLQLE